MLLKNRIKFTIKEIFFFLAIIVSGTTINDERRDVNKMPRLSYSIVPDDLISNSLFLNLQVRDSRKSTGTMIRKWNSCYSCMLRANIRIITIRKKRSLWPILLYCTKIRAHAKTTGYPDGQLGTLINRWRRLFWHHSSLENLSFSAKNSNYLSLKK